MARMDLLESSRESVSNSYQAYDFMRHVIDEFGRVDAQVSAKCLDLLSILCPLNLAKFKEQYGTNDTKFSQDVLDQCQDISRYSGYVEFESHGGYDLCLPNKAYYQTMYG
ncbi:hypothetical protein BASA81_013737 [Batrachochytrium salamandrivorans]|nr:hypothetical protein BASA81_013737 [Batrachochytrium salamandrivorans]